MFRRLWMSRRSSFLCFVLLIAAANFVAAQDPWAAPASYYSGVSGTGATLQAQLKAAMSSGHILRSYGDFRFSAAITDQDPNNASNVLLVYNRASVPATWDSGATWNREHVWPDSRQPGNASNGATGAIADPHALRPSNPGVNSSRSNNPFGFENNTGSYGNIGGGYWYPGDADRGDVSRTLFYMDTRWDSQGLSLTDAFPSGFQMGDLSSAIAWHYLDPPDEFERRRNHTIFSPSYNPNFYTNNRNAFIDHPEYVWSVYMNQQNNSQVTIGGGVPGASGGSTLDADFGPVIVGAAGPATQPVLLNKAGTNGTYFSVTATGDATSNLQGGYNAFRNGATDARTIQVGVDGGTSIAGPRSGTVTIDNLDVTNLGGAGVGANDANDVITVSMSVLDHARPSFSDASVVTSLAYDFGAVALGSAASASFDLFNLIGTAGYSAGLDLDAVAASGDSQAFFTTLAPLTNLAAGASSTFMVGLDTSVAGGFSVAYTLSLSDQDLSGATALGDLMITLQGVVGSGMLGDFNLDGDIDANDIDLLAANAGSSDPFYDLNGDSVVDFSPSPAGDLLTDSDVLVRQILGAEYGDANLDGMVDIDDLSALSGGFGTGSGWAAGDFNGSGAVDIDDLSTLSGSFGFNAAVPVFAAKSVPEPAALLLMAACSGLLGARRRRCGV